jgi:hypothetical protein
MKKQLLIVAIALAACGFSVAQAQTVSFVYDDGGAGGGLPSSGTYTPGSTFTFAIDLVFVPGGSVTNLDGLSYWFTQQSPASPQPFAITNRDVTGPAVGGVASAPSIFSDLQTPSLTYPQNLSPTNANDLGGAIPVGMPPGSEAVGAGTYFVANITVSIPLSAPTSGTYVISDNTTGAKTSVISDSFGHTFAIPEADYTITMVPEPATWLTPILGMIALVFVQRRRIAKFCHAS